MNLDARLTGAQAARWIGVSRQCIYQWVSRGHLTAGTDGLYRLGDVLNAEKLTRSNGARRSTAA